MSTPPDGIGKAPRPVGWLGWVLVTVTVLLYSDISISALQGSQDNNAASAVAIWTGATVAYFRHRRGKHAWLGFFIGLVLGFVAYGVILFICGAIRRYQ